MNTEMFIAISTYRAWLETWQHESFCDVLELLLLQKLSAKNK